MSEETNTATASEKPEQVKELEQTLNDLNQYHRLVQASLFQGSQAKVAGKLLDFLSNVFQQVLGQHNAHPYVKGIQEAAQPEAAAQTPQEQAEEAAIEVAAQ